MYKYVKKVHDVTAMNPKLGTYFLHSLHRQFSGFHSLIPFLKATTLANCINSNFSTLVFQKMTTCPRIIDASTSHVGD